MITESFHFATNLHPVLFVKKREYSAKKSIQPICFAICFAYLMFYHIFFVVQKNIYRMTVQLDEDQTRVRPLKMLGTCPRDHKCNRK